jgi:glutaminyl-tRNA synthetase
VNTPEDASAGVREVPFGREIYIEADDFREDPPKKFHRLSPGAEVRLRWAYVIRCERVIKDASGAIVELRCTYDTATGRSAVTADGRRVKGTIHWVSVPHAVTAEVRLYDRLFSSPMPDAEDRDFMQELNPASLEVLAGAKIEPSVQGASPGTRYQFERTGYFCVDPESSADRLVFNRTVGLRDTWGKIEAKSTDRA